MRRLLVFQHVPHEILGNLDPLLRDARFRIRYVNFGREPDAQPDVSKYNGLIVLGGPMNCDEADRYPHLSTETAAIQQAIRDGIPVLGICLGAQLIARALGARVHSNPVQEIGWYELNPTDEGHKDPLCGKFAESQQIFQWHGDTFEIPHGAVHLATSPDCANQAFRFKHNVYGFQFHLEVDEPMILRWLSTPYMARAAEEAGGPGRIDDIKRHTHEHIQHSIGLGNEVFGEFIHLFDRPPKRTTLPSR
ncbi:MAG: gamma-glutamyl-gamma-aminobutyrate hydrolase family protein [Gammaproteobacteria bacterium]|nr:gamma-glutamyl-gamma-aminobutyrate hydrolase family protein [Gammaproteobacteria bacterium]MBT8444664.1 gamma-glutamyl-gamma-aminobutyrate hydrolase family protein [Gammaproteobacteria bacterium]NND37387.1 C26 family cysteine hydrolase domain-containing family [Gammaproteobacteria bacterium]